jgi:hypothetical protein
MIDESHEIFTRWDKEKEVYKPAIIDLKTGDTWPREPNPAEKPLAAWRKVVMDPASKTFFKGKEPKRTVSEDGVETVTQTEVEPHQVITTIQRERIEGDEEYLLTKGYIMAYNQFGEPHPYHYSFLGRWWETTFVYETALEDSSGQLRRQCRGPQGGFFHYTKPFTVKNVDELWEMRDKKRLTSLVVHDAVSDRAKQAINIDVFKNKGFDYIMNDEHLSEKEREERMLEEQARQGIAQVPTKGKK